MPKINVNKELSGSAQLNYMKLMEKENMERVRRLQRVRQRNIFTGLLLAAGVFSVCILLWLYVVDENDPPSTSQPLHISLI